MKTIRYIIYTMLCVMGITACQDDLMNRTSEGADVNKPVQVDLKFAVPNSMQVEVTRADNTRSGMYNAQIYVFSENDFLSSQTVSTDDATLVKGGRGEDGQYYTVKNLTLYEGEQYVYAVGNTSTGLWENDTLTKLENAAKEGRDRFEEVLYTLSNVIVDGKTYPNFASGYMPLSGYGKVKVQDGQPEGNVKLKRLVAQIKFVIYTSYKEGNKEVTFEPSSYAFYNIAAQSSVLNTETADVAKDVYHANPVNIASAGDDHIAEFDVHIPENLQSVKVEGCGDYDDRESFEGTGSDKKWVYAPDKATYVVLKGICKEITDGKLTRYGDVEYTIHLGDFSEKTGSMDNFSVERNNIYTYTVKVHGLEKIKVEAEKTPEEYQNGAEGNVIEMGDASKIFSLDAHYEQVFVEYNLSDILRKVQELNPNSESATENKVKKNIANHFLLAIHSPMNTVSSTEELRLPYDPDNSGYEEKDMAGIDYRWIEFYPQKEDETISLYPGENSDELYSPYEICRMMGDAIYQLYMKQQPSSDNGLILIQENGDWKARFTIFIDEYFYRENLAHQLVAWDAFTGKEARTMMIASNMQISEDHNSTYSTAQTYITQHSIATFYKPEASGTTNALGLETYNENGVIQGFGDPNRSSDDWSNGRDNMLTNLGIVSSGVQDWRSYIDFTQVGYTDDNSSSGNVWNYSGLKYNAAVKACMARNRDLNGDGKIDKDEVRWYLPALSQYLRIGIGVKALPSETRLYVGDKSTMIGASYPDNYLEDGALYYVNTSNPPNNDYDYTLYWAVEVGAYGSPTMGGKAMIRCVRNLPKKTLVNDAGMDEERLVGTEALAEPVYGELKAIGQGNTKNAVFDFGDRLVESIFRPSETPQREPYEPHNEEDVDQMMLPGAFVVASKDIEVSNYQIAFGIYTNGVWSYGDDPCSSYYEKSDRSDRGYWRTPSLNELMVMSTANDQINMKTNSYSRTQFSNTNVRKGFYFNTSKIITASDNELGRGYVRCVRDATEADLQEARAW
ncbi:DUF4906 domain-containing protein [Bacteroides sp. Marseille-P3684]|uniref:DUF4906 domain-containing protein n=1 Tax=Bacteroides sp. Marseille-P3684 TaxID=2086579 RepID=UPI000D0ACBCA|nr:DUF4906 domain-containing protein [Bacteroides sp. Marseille-P3684]